MSASDSNESKKLKIKEAFDALLSLNSAEMDSTLLMVKTEAFRRAFRRFKSSPEELEKKVMEVENAFSQLSQVKRILTEADNPSSRENISAKLRTAREHFNQQNYPAALLVCEEVIAMGRRTEEIYLLSATSALYAKNLKKADYYGDEVLKLNPDNPHALVTKAMTIKESDPFKAFEYLDRAFCLRPQSKTIRNYREQLLALIQRLKSNSPAESYSTKRKWMRAKLIRDFQINDLGTSLVYGFKTISLSAGGCLVKGTDLPEQFQFTLELKGFGKVWGRGRVAYTLESGQSGIRFIDLDKVDENKIDNEVKSKAA